MKLLLTSMGLNTERLQKEFTSLLTKSVKDVKVQILFIEFMSPYFNKYMEEVRLSELLINLGCWGWRSHG